MSHRVLEKVGVAMPDGTVKVVENVRIEFRSRGHFSIGHADIDPKQDYAVKPDDVREIIRKKKQGSEHEPLTFYPVDAVDSPSGMSEFLPARFRFVPCRMCVFLIRRRNVVTQRSERCSCSIAGWNCSSVQKLSS